MPRIDKGYEQGFEWIRGFLFYFLDKGLTTAWVVPWTFWGWVGCTMHRLHTSMILSTNCTRYRHASPISTITALECPTTPLSMLEYNFPA